MHKCLGEREVLYAFLFRILVMIPKDDVGERGIGLLEALHKLISNIINGRMVDVIEFCDEIYGSRKKRGTYTAFGETKL